MNNIKLNGWIEKNQILKFHRNTYGWGDRLHLEIFRGNPNPNNYSNTNHWKKVNITIEDADDI